MKSNLIQINKAMLQKLPYKEDVKYALSKKSPVLKVTSGNYSHVQKRSRMIDIEVALRKCKRLGVFRE